TACGRIAELHLDARQMTHWVYILASRRRGTLYVGVTRDPAARVAQHRMPNPGSLTSRYAVHRLAHLEPFEDPIAAIEREKRLQRWSKDSKIALIEKGIPASRELYKTINA